MTIIQISGKLRQGKGILLVLYALAFLQAGGKVLCNFKIYHPNASLIDFYGLLDLLRKPAPDVPVMICIDELPTWIDSYCSTKADSNRYAGHFCNQSAKLGYELRYTTQRTRRADINYREMVDESYRAEKQSLCNRRLCDVRCPKINVCRFVYNELDSLNINEDVETGRKMKIHFSVARFWWGKYNTFERVIPEGLTEFFFELEKSDPKRFVVTVDRQARLLQGHISPRTSVAGFELALMQVGELPSFAKYVKERLQTLP